MQDSDVLNCILAVRREWAGLPQRLFMDGAICTSRSVSKLLLEKMGLSLTHSMATNSLCQAKVERFIGTISRSILKLQTASPSTSFETLVDEARLSYNNTCTSNLGGKCPSDLHFFRSNANLTETDGSMPISGLMGDVETMREVFNAKRAAQDQVLHGDVRRFMMRREAENVGDRDDRLKISNLAFKKRTSFWTGAPSKLQFRVDEDAFEIVSRVATNSFRCMSIVDGRVQLLPGDHFVKTNLPKDKLQALVAKMLCIRRSESSNAPPSSSTRRTANEVLDAVAAALDFLESSLSRLFS